jgi:hypothetical protein
MHRYALVLEMVDPPDVACRRSLQQAALDDAMGIVDENRIAGARRALAPVAAKPRGHGLVVLDRPGEHGLEHHRVHQRAEEEDVVPPGCAGRDERGMGGSGPGEHGHGHLPGPDLNGGGA